METNVLELVTNPTSMADKQSIMDAVEQMKQRYAEGGLCVHPLRELIILKQIEAFCKEAQKVAMPWAVQEADLLNDKERKCVHNAKVAVKSGGTKYDYSGSAEWQELKAEEDAYTEEAKMAANKRKAVEKNMEMVGTAVATETTAPSLVITLL